MILIWHGIDFLHGKSDPNFENVTIGLYSRDRSVVMTLAIANSVSAPIKGREWDQHRVRHNVYRVIHRDRQAEAGGLKRITRLPGAKHHCDTISEDNGQG